MTGFLFESGPRRGERVTLAEDRVYTVGSAPECDIRIDDELVSPIHCKIRGKEGRFYVKDAGSENGTLVNDRPVEVVRLEPGDKLALGTTILTFLGDESDERVGKELDGYRILERIGRGGMGTVYRAEQLSLHREVALKVLPPELGRDATFRERFLREARAAAQLNHPNIVQVYDAGEADGLLFYAMEFVPGGTIEDRILASPGGLPLDEALRYLSDAAQALDYAANKGIVHRDVKPENLMITELGGVKLADLGLAHPVRGDRDDAGRFGTPHFLAPEQARGEPVDIRADLYSLGATFYRMLTGETMYHGRTAREIVRKQIQEPPPPLRAKRPDVPEAIERIYLKLVAKDPDERFSTPAELLSAIEEARGRPRRRRALLLGVLGVLAAAAAASLWPTSTSEAPPVAVGNSLGAPVEPARSPAPTDLAEDLERQRLALERQARENEAMAALLRLEEELDAVPAEEAVRRLGEFAAAHEGTEAAEKALRHARDLEEEIAERRRREAQTVAAVEKAAAALDRALEALDRSGPAEALRAIATWGGAPEALRDREALVAARARAAERLARWIEERLERVEKEAREAIAADDIESASARIEELRSLGELTGEVPAGLEALAQALTRARGLAEELAAAREEAERRLHRARRRADLATLRYDPLFAEAAEAARAHRFGDARQALERIVERLATDDYRRAAVRRLEDARAAERMVAEWAARIASSAGTATVTHPLRGVSARIVEFDRQRQAVLLEVRRGAAASRGYVDLTEFAAPERFVEIYLAGSSDSSSDAPAVARALLIHRLGRLAETASGIAAILADYDPQRGWTDEQRAALAQLRPPPVSCELLDRALADAGEAAEEVRARIAREGEAQAELEKALAPFLAQNAAGFRNAAEALEAFCRRYAETDVFLALHPVLAGLDSPWEPRP